MFIKLIVFLLISILYIHSSGTSYAFEHTLITEQELKLAGFNKYESINPNLLIFPIKQIIEKIKLSLIFNKEDKTKYQYTLLDKRLNELVYIINYKKTSFLEEAVNRYNVDIGNLIENNKDSSLRYKDKLSNYVAVLKTLQDRYSSISSYRLLIQYAIDTTRRLI